LSGHALSDSGKPGAGLPFMEVLFATCGGHLWVRRAMRDTLVRVLPDGRFGRQITGSIVSPTGMIVFSTRVEGSSQSEGFAYSLKLFREDGTPVRSYVVRATRAETLVPRGVDYVVGLRGMDSDGDLFRK